MLVGVNDPERRMNLGKTLFAQVPDFVPRKTFGRIIEQHKGDAGVRKPCGGDSIDRLT